MKPINKPTKQIEKIEVWKPKPTKKRYKIIERQTKAKSFKKWLQSTITLLHNDNKLETEQILKTILNKYNQFDKKNGNFVQVEIIDGWKGKFSTQIFPNGFNKDFVIIQRIKNKETKEVEETKHIIYFENVNRLLKFILTWKKGETRTCYDFAEIVGESNWKEVWKKRTEVYFPLYYYPIKILETLDIIKYGGRGQITRLI